MPATTALSRSRGSEVFTSRCGNRCDHLRPLSPALSPTGRGRCSLRPLSPALSPAGRGRCSLRPLSPALSPTGRGRCSPSPGPLPAGERELLPLNGSGKWHAEQAWIGRRAENVLIEVGGGRIKTVEGDT